MAYKRTTRKRKVSGVKPTVRRRKAANGRGTVRVKVWAASEISKLRKCYRNTTNGEIAKILGRSVASVRAKAGALSLKKNKNLTHPRQPDGPDLKLKGVEGGLLRDIDKILTQC